MSQHVRLVAVGWPAACDRLASRDRGHHVRLGSLRGLSDSLGHLSDSLGRHVFHLDRLAARMAGLVLPAFRVDGLARTALLTGESRHERITMDHRATHRHESQPALATMLQRL